MLSKESFVDFILKGPDENAATTSQSPVESALPDGFEGFDPADTQPATAQHTSSFARRLLEASGFGYAEMVQRDSVIRSTDAVARYLPERVAFWPKTSSRSYQTLLFETELNHKQLLSIPAFRSRKMAHLDIVEDALARLVSEALEGFQRGGETVTADVRKGRKEETLCVVSILDGREDEHNPVRHVCFGTQNRTTSGLETFQLTERTKSWDAQIARDHLGLLYERQFKKLGYRHWQEAFTTTEERKQAAKLLAVCTRKAPRKHDIQESVLNLLDTIAKGFGLRKRPKTERRLQAFDLPPDHDIGIDPEERKSSFGGTNPLGGVTLRDERSRLLGYIVYPLKNATHASRLRKHLRKNNRFHNVLVVYPDEKQASLELWQGGEQLTGKLRKGQGYRDAADVVNLLSRFFVVSKSKVRNPTELAQELAYRARYLRRLAVKQLEDEPATGPLRDLYASFKRALVHDISESSFADAYAQTITYCLLTARWMGNTQLGTGHRFTRQSALAHVPTARPFLNELFKSALSVTLDVKRGRLLWLVDDIADLLDRVDVEFVFGAGDTGTSTATDPVIHFYEPFLDAYDKQLKKELGVFYTPRPVVSFIVRALDALLRVEFLLPDGLADTSTWEEMAQRHTWLRIPDGILPTQSFVQILDPATGTGTFLVEIIEVIHKTMMSKWNASGHSSDESIRLWNEYVPRHLLPRLHGYEILMAPYAIAHLKVALKLTETGYKVLPEDHTRIFLTNALEAAHEVSGKFAFAIPVLAGEAASVNSLKRVHAFTTIVANPPYANYSANLTEEARAIVDKYRYFSGRPIRERNQLQFERNLQDDFVKFIAIGEDEILHARAGVMGYITNATMLASSSLRGMREHLLAEFDKLYELHLHGGVNEIGEKATEDQKRL